jgi:hypothetical protein
MELPAVAWPSEGIENKLPRLPEIEVHMDGLVSSLTRDAGIARITGENHG